MTVIITEGVDRCGKSTQIKRMMKLFAKENKPMQWLHFTSIKGLTPEHQTELFKSTFEHMFKLISNENAIWFLDRSHLGEEVYGSIYRPNIDTSYIWDLEKKYGMDKRNDVFLIIFYDSSFKNVTERDDGDSLSTDLDIVKKEVEGFKRAYKNTSIQNKILIDIAEKDIDLVAKEIEEFLTKF